MGTKSSFTTVLVLAAAASGCGTNYWNSNEVALAPVDGAPVEITAVKMRHSRVIGIGSAPTKMTSGDPANSIGVEFSVKKTGETPDHAGVGAQMICLVDGHAVRTVLAHDASARLSKLAVGGSLTENDQLLPTPFQDEIPQTCEAQLFYMVQPPLQAASPGEPEPPDLSQRVALGSVCMTDGTLRPGPCSTEELPRPAPTGAVAVEGVRATIGARQDGGFGISVVALVTAGASAPGEWRVGAEARCETDQGPRDVPVMMWLSGRDLQPGESRTGAGASARPALATEPTACTVAIRMATGSERTDLAEYCVRGSETTEGACA